MILDMFKFIIDTSTIIPRHKLHMGFQEFAIQYNAAAMKIATATPFMIFHFVSMLYLPSHLRVYVILICLSSF